MQELSGSYRELKVWQKSMDMAEAVYDLTAYFPEDERYSLTNQIKRSSVSVSSNIAEGQGRGSNRDFQRCLWIANGSLKEMESQLIFAGRRAWITRDQAADAWELAQESGKMLKGLIRSLD